MTQLTSSDVQRLAVLANIDIDEQKAVELAADMQNIIGYVELLDQVDVDGLTPTEQVTGLVNVTRDDTVRYYGVSQAELLKNLPAVEDNQIKVRRVL
jgi:aspartyl-tRNA(Asn)/glutamyl-tRNA(Gln) amidotransferase subunit C